MKNLSAFVLYNTRSILNLNCFSIIWPFTTILISSSVLKIVDKYYKIQLFPVWCCKNNNLFTCMRQENNIFSLNSTISRYSYSTAHSSRRKFKNYWLWISSQHPATESFRIFHKCILQTTGVCSRQQWGDIRVVCDSRVYIWRAVKSLWHNKNSPYNKPP
jgi:hypothetical protein